MSELERIRARVSRYEPVIERRTGESREAAVAVIFRASDGAAPDLLFIERARREGDPWSGQMAFPGGRREPGDSDLSATATRETFEEVGLELQGPIGRLDDVSGTRGLRSQRLVVAPFVFHIGDPAPVHPGPEVEEAVWVPVPHLLDPESHGPYRFERDGFGATFPSVRYGRFTIWGLTYRIVLRLFQITGHDLPESSA